MRFNRALKNIISSFLFQIVTIVSGLVIPRLIIYNFGSDMNGLVVSVTRFLSYIVLLEGGIGGVIRAEFYKPLSDKDYNKVTKIFNASTRFFKRLGYFSLVYIVAIAAILSQLSKDDFDVKFTIILVVAIGIGTFFNYYYGISYQLLLTSMQRNYLINVIQAVVILLNIVISYVFITNGYSLALVKGLVAVILCVRPFVFRFFLKRSTNLQLTQDKGFASIDQKWDGLAHHIAFLIHTNTDVVLLTFFSTFKEISVYSIYFMITTSLRKGITSISSSLEAIFGDVIASEDLSYLNEKFNIYESVILFLTAVLFGVCYVVIIPFVSLFTEGLTDVNYVRPLFAVIIILAEMAGCIRIAYNTLVYAAGHYRQTKVSAYIEAMINIVISLILIHSFGIVGLAIGTLSAMTYRTIYLIIYTNKYIVRRSLWLVIRKMIVLVIGIISGVIISIRFVNIESTDFIMWTVYAMVTTLIIGGICSILFALFYKDEVLKMKQFIMKRFNKSS